MPPNPCLACGACCAYFRASFYWAECDDATPGGVPAALTEDLGPHRRAMRGTCHLPARCVALAGEIGESVFCQIYERRSSVCRAFFPSLLDGVRNEECDKARLAHGLPPLAEKDWHEPMPDPTPLKPRPKRPRRPTRRAA